MKIKFKQIDEQNIKIIGIEEGLEREIGCIFTPSSSAQNITNSIQICGFKEAFDLWGCFRYVTFPTSLKNTVKGIETGKIKWESAKDIQLFFTFNIKPRSEMGNDMIGLIKCERCLNRPCVCENKKGNPFKVKMEKDLKELEYKKHEKKK